MQFSILIVIYAVLVVGTIASEGEIGIKKGTFPYMAIIYYPDQIGSSARFTRSAVLIRENWLVSSTLDNDGAAASFPVKTLVARLGAITIDANFTLNEDEDEQEREIIQLVRPYISNSTWWHTDISLLKTLLPFNLSSSVSTISIRSHKFGSDENCFILFYAKREQNERLLLQMFVELLPSSSEKCGKYFYNETMICASRNEEKIENIDPSFCQGNSGGPLICNNELTGIQTYVDDCTEPYLYQLLTAWDDLMICAMEEKCHEEQCAKICLNIYKDPPSTTTAKFETNLETTEDALMKLVGYFNETSSEIEVSPTVTTTVTTLKEFDEVETTKTTLTIVMDEQVTTSTVTLAAVTHTPTTTEDTTLLSSTTSDASEPNEIISDDPTEYREERERNVNVEAQQKPKRLHSDATLNTITLFYCITYTFIILTCVI